jgi:hypothetical protein
MAGQRFDRLAALTVLDIAPGDVIRLRRRHPCGVDTWQVVRTGADIGIRCQGCGRRVLLERRALERRLIAFVERTPREEPPA